MVQRARAFYRLISSPLSPDLPAAELVALLPAVKKAIPDFSWTHATAGGKDDAGYSIVKIQARALSCVLGTCLPVQRADRVRPMPQQKSFECEQK